MKICVFYSIDKNNNETKFYNWHDGFVACINLLKEKHNVKMINYCSLNNDFSFDDFDVVIIKAGFYNRLYDFFYKNHKKKNIILCLAISSSNTIPSNIEIQKYNVLFFETFWYYNYANLKRHEFAFHAFGCDTSIMKKIKCEKKYSAIFVGTIIEYKRPLNLFNIDGKKIFVGNIGDKDIHKKIINNKDSTFIDYCSYSELAEYYNQSNICYVPCKLHGGGERAVLEARACNIPVKIEKDNEKLCELLHSQIYNHIYYMNQIEYGIQFYVNKLKQPNANKIIKQPNANKIIKQPIAVKMIKKPIAVKIIKEPIGVKMIKKPIAVKMIKEPIAVKIIKEPIAVKIIKKPIAVKMIKKPIAAKIIEQTQAQKKKIEQGIKNIINKINSNEKNICNVQKLKLPHALSHKILEEMNENNLIFQKQKKKLENKKKIIEITLRRHKKKN
jgi:glycosyltransferase involved in cell wall biosynthesis